MRPEPMKPLPWERKGRGTVGGACAPYRRCSCTCSEARSEGHLVLRQRSPRELWDAALDLVPVVLRAGAGEHGWQRVFELTGVFNRFRDTSEICMPLAMI